MIVRPALPALCALVVLMGCSGGSRTTESSNGSSATTSTVETSEGSTGAASTTTDATTGVGTTFDPGPAGCDAPEIRCTPPYIDPTTGTDTGTDTDTDTDTDTGTHQSACDPYYVELEDTAKGNCPGDLVVIGHQVSWQGACCLEYLCKVPRPEAKACIPLAHASGCKSSLPGIRWDEVCGMLGTLSEPFIDGDLCCAHFDCYCGDTG